LIIQSNVPESWRKPGAIAGVVGVAGLTIYYWNESMPVHAYGVMLAIAALVAITVGVARSPMLGFKKTDIVDLGLFAVLWGVIGARAFHVFERHELYFNDGEGILNALAVWNGGLVFYGGLIGGMGYVVYYAFRHGDGGKTLLKIFDLGAPCVLFGLAFGRIGCFLNGCCYGSPTDVPWSVAYRSGYGWISNTGGFAQATHICQAIYTDGSRSSQWRELMQHQELPEKFMPVTYHVHPAQLYGSVMAILIGIFLSYLFYKKLRVSWVSCAFLLTYPIDRFVLEGWFRGDTPAAFPSISSSLTISQYVSIVGFIAGIIWLIVLLVTGRKAKAEAQAAPAT
jgi:phosphatidylglycerol:prolipoprotein diacylglycerol transferase